VQRDYVVCLECGFRGQALRRHLRVQHGLEVAAYRTRWNLPSDHPVTAPAYSARRSALAKQIGLGRRRARSGRRPRPGGGVRGGRGRTNPAFPLWPAGKSCLDRSISAITIRAPLTQYRQDFIPPVQCLRQPAEMLIDISDVENRAARLEHAKMVAVDGQERVAEYRSTSAQRF